jgi:hypothetical protein
VTSRDPRLNFWEAAAKTRAAAALVSRFVQRNQPNIDEHASIPYDSASQRLTRPLLNCALTSPWWTREWFEKGSDPIQPPARSVGGPRYTEVGAKVQIIAERR